MLVRDVESFPELEKATRLARNHRGPKYYFLSYDKVAALLKRSSRETPVKRSREIAKTPRDRLPTGAVRDACSVYALFKTSLFRNGVNICRPFGTETARPLGVVSSPRAERREGGGSCADHREGGGSPASEKCEKITPGAPQTAKFCCAPNVRAQTEPNCVKSSRWHTNLSIIHSMQPVNPAHAWGHVRTN